MVERTPQPEEVDRSSRESGRSGAHLSVGVNPDKKVRCYGLQRHYWVFATNEGVCDA
jgi:hypothetical protein